MSKQDISSLQVLRGFAALAVVCHHAFRAVTVNRPMGFYFPDSYISSSAIFVELGAMGVDLFFILSGFLMIYISQPYMEGKKSTFDFLASRIIRVWPLYCVVTLFICYSTFRNLPTGGSAFDLQTLRLLSFIFVPSFNEHGRLQPILGVGWTLNYEVYFYLIFTISLIFRNANLLFFSSGLVLASYTLGSVFPAGSVAHEFLFNSVMLEFILGAGIATAYIKGKFSHRREWVWLALGVVLLFFLAKFPADSSFRIVTRGLPAALIFIFILLSDKKISWPRVFLLIGNSSYSIYLMHIPILYIVAPRVMVRMSRFGFPAMAAEVGALLAIVAAVLIGIAVHFILEKPLTRFAKYVYRKLQSKLAIEFSTAKP